MQTSLSQTVEQLVSESFKRQPMRAIEVGGADGIIVGGILIVRGEREFQLLCSYLMQPKPEIKEML